MVQQGSAGSLVPHPTPPQWARRARSSFSASQRKICPVRSHRGNRSCWRGCPPWLRGAGALSVTGTLGNPCTETSHNGAHQHWHSASSSSSSSSCPCTMLTFIMGRPLSPLYLMFILVVLYFLLFFRDLNNDTFSSFSLFFLACVAFWIVLPPSSFCSFLF